MESQNNDTFKTEHVDDYEILLIKPNYVEDLDFRHPDYVEMIMNKNCFEKIESTIDQFENIISCNFDFTSNKNRNLITKMIHEDQDYLYELIYLDNQIHTVDTYNGIGSLLTSDELKVWGNALLLKTKVDILSDSMKMDKCKISDLYNIFVNRKYHYGVILEDGEWIECKFSNIDEQVEDYFINNPKKEELGFLRHNLNVYYTKSDKGINIGKLINEKVDQCLIFSKMNDQILTNISVDEVKKILSLSEKMENFNVVSDDMKEEKDELGRDILKNKYRILHNYTLKYNN